MGEDRERYRFWSWDFRRSDGSVFNVCLNQYKSVDSFSVTYDVAVDLSAQPGEAHSPKLRRAAVVSCPLFVADGQGHSNKPVHDELNAKLRKGLETAIENFEAFPY